VVAELDDPDPLVWEGNWLLATIRHLRTNAIIPGLSTDRGQRLWRSWRLGRGEAEEEVWKRWLEAVEDGNKDRDVSGGVATPGWELAKELEDFGGQQRNQLARDGVHGRLGVDDDREAVAHAPKLGC
jgi:hypothetical protein